MANKFGAKKVHDDGYCFASKAEHRRYCSLKLRQRAGQISGLTVHPRFTLKGLNGGTIGRYTYDAACCNEQDCAPLPIEAVEETAAGYRVRAGGKVWDFVYGEHQWSTDARFHICVYDPATGPGGRGEPSQVFVPILPENRKPCFYAPPPGV